MAVTSCKFLTNSWSASGDATFKNSVTASWQIETDSEYDGPQQVKTGAHGTGPNPLPVEGASYSYGNDSSAFLFAQQWTLSPSFGSGSHGKTWIFTWTYATLGDKEPGDFVQNPLNRPVKWESESVEFEVPMLEQTNGLKIKNRAKLEYNPPATAVRSDRVLLATKNIATLAQVLSIETQLMGTNGLGGKNDATWQGFAAGKVKALAPRVGGVNNENGANYYPVTFRFQVRTKREYEAFDPGTNTPAGDKWTLDLIERGNYVLTQPPTQVRVVPMDEQTPGVTLPPPYLLDIDGTHLPQNSDPIATAWDIYEDVDFGAILGF